MTQGHAQSGTYSADAPVSDPTKDSFGRVPFARRIANTLAARHDATSLVVGIYGTWGQGKTSVLNFIAEELSTHVLATKAS